jgi:molecular chaperone HscB
MATSARQIDGQSAGLPNCARCDQPLAAAIVCEHCHALHEAPAADHFAVLGLAPAYELDTAALRERYFRLARRLHPDRAAGDEARERLGLRLAARLNRAFEVLGDPVQRAEHLLELAGGASASEDKTVPQGVLMETLELRERLDEASDPQARAELSAQVQERRHELLASIAKAARQLPGDEAVRSDLRGALNAIRYYERLSEQLGCA